MNTNFSCKSLEIVRKDSEMRYIIIKFCLINLFYRKCNFFSRLFKILMQILFMFAEAFLYEEYRYNYNEKSS
jgi:glucan phosphoethanolaminetransferase (alkaline phosphatase superfamily)